MKYLKNLKAILLTATIMMTTTDFVSTAAAFSITANVTAKNTAQAYKKGWNLIKNTRKFKRWASGVRYTAKAWKGHVCVTTVFVGGNGKVWYIYLDAKKRGKKYKVRARNTPLRSDCKNRL